MPSSTRHRFWWRLLTVAFALVLLPSSLLAAQPPATYTSSDGDTPVLDPRLLPAKGEGEDEEEAEAILKRDDAFSTRRTAGDAPLTIAEAAQERRVAQRAAQQLRKAVFPAVSPVTFGSAAWSPIGPNPIVQVTRGSQSFYAVSGRVSALAIRPSTGLKILGAAQGGIWTYNETTETWTPRTDDQSTLSIGALAIAPSNDAVVYAGTGEGALSGDSYFGNGVLRSNDGGLTWAHVSGSSFVGVSISKMAVDPTNASHVWAAVIRGRGGARRTTPAETSTYGIWESKDAGGTWKLVLGTQKESNGATEVLVDPRNPKNLYASFWGDAIYKSTDGGAHWKTAMTGFPAGADFAALQTRFALGISHPVGDAKATLYAGFEWVEGGAEKPSRIWKSTDDGEHWTLAGAGSGLDSVVDYCGTQCWYDNEIGVDPNDANIVYALGLFNYSNGSGGVFRSMDGGGTWKDLGWDLHPDYHSIAINPANTSEVMVGNDGGVWFSSDRGGRLDPADPVDAADFQFGNLNGTVNPASAGIIHRSNLQITQFTSMANVSQLPLRVWGGTQDNGTLRKTGSANQQWFDIPSGDGGQVLVDPTDPNYVFGTYYGVSPYRMDDGGLTFFGNDSISGGINTSDRSEFYIPWVMNQGNPDQLFLGTYRLYRTDNAKADSAGDVHWNAISGDLTSGCSGSAPNGARGCVLSAIGLAQGGSGVYTAALDGVVYFSPDAVTSATPTWIRVDHSPLPNRPPTSIAVDRSNYRIAYIGYAGFNRATPGHPGHVFRTTDAGQTWIDITSNLPDSPVNSVVLDPSYPGTLYAGTDVGPFVTYNGGKSWERLGAGFPSVAIWQIAYDQINHNMRAGTHGRGAWTLHDGTASPALVVSKSDSGAPVGPGSLVNYTITVDNIGNADATGVSISDPIPANTTWVSGGTLSNGAALWTGLTVAAGDSTSVELTVKIADPLGKKVASIVNDGVVVSSAEGVGTTGSPHSTPLAQPNAVTVSPAAQTDGARVGESISYTLHVENRGYLSDSYTLTAAGATFPTTILDSSCVTPLSTTGALAPGAAVDVCVKVDVPSGATNGTTDHVTVTVTSASNPAVTGTATIDTIAVAVDTLLVDNDGNGPDVAAYYKDALTAAGVPFNYWDLAANSKISSNFMAAHKNIVWFTGAAYPGPLLPYEAQLATYLDGGGNLFVSGWDILDQAAGTTDFVYSYLHVNWPGDESQNDKATATVTAEAGNVVTDGLGTVALDLSVYGGAQFSDQLTLVDPAAVAFRDASGAPNGLTVEDTTAGSPYKVVFLAFPFEEFGNATNRSDLMTRVIDWFTP